MDTCPMDDCWKRDSILCPVFAAAQEGNVYGGASCSAYDQPRDADPVLIELAQKLIWTNPDFKERLIAIANAITEFAHKYEGGDKMGIGASIPRNTLIEPDSTGVRRGRGKLYSGRGY